MFAGWWIGILIALIAAVHTQAAPATSTGTTTLPDPELIIRRVVERARAVAAETNGPTYAYENLSVYETFARDGTLKRAKEKLYQVTLKAGMTSNRLISVDGRRLSNQESAGLSESERRWRDSYATGPSGSSTERVDDVINERLFARFAVSGLGRETLRGRPCFVLSLQPRTGELPEDRLIDRVINLLEGKLWVDEAEYEILRGEVKTVGKLRLWGGMLGSLESLQLHVDRERSVYGVWFNRHLEVVLRGRKLFSAVLIRAREVGSHLHPLETVGEPGSTSMPSGTPSLPGVH